MVIRFTNATSVQWDDPIYIESSMIAYIYVDRSSPNPQVVIQLAYGGTCKVMESIEEVIAALKIIANL